MVANDEDDKQHTENAQKASRNHNEAPPHIFRKPGGHWKKEQLSGSIACAQHADDQAATVCKPSRCNGCAQYVCGHASCDPNHHAPRQPQLPKLGDTRRQQQASYDKSESCRDNRPYTVALKESSREWGDDTA